MLLNVVRCSRVGSDRASAVAFCFNVVENCVLWLAGSDALRATRLQHSLTPCVLPLLASRVH